MTSPKVSVLMSVYNGQRYLREAVESILNQTFTDFEFIIVDDGSTDNTWQILQGYAASEPQIVLVRNETNVGLAKSLNRGLSLARGEYIARMDADDVSLPERLAAQMAFLDEHPEVGVVGSSVQLIGTDGSLGNVWRYPTMHALILWTLCFVTPFTHPTVAFRRAVVEGVGGYNDALSANQDRDLWRRLSSITRFGNLPDVYLLYREHHSNSVSQRYADIQARNSAMAGQRLMTRLLGYEVPFEVCHSFRLKRFEAMDDAIQAMRVISSLYDAFMTKESLSSSEKRAIRGDAAQRIIRLAWPFRHQAKMRRELLALTFRTNPLLTSMVAKLLLPRVLRKPWRLILQ
jgi:glycosyltransferase involved in cell wall biosynthesis